MEGGIENIWIMESRSYFHGLHPCTTCVILKRRQAYDDIVTPKVRAMRAGFCV